MSFWSRLLKKLLRRQLEKKLAVELVDRHWPTIEKALRAEFSGSCLDVALRAARRACERFIEHVI